MRGCLVYNGSFVNHQVTGMIESFSRAFKALGVGLFPVVSDEFIICYDGGINILYKGKAFDKASANFILFWDKDIRLAKAFESLGIPVFNNARAIETCDNKLATHEKLCGHDIPMPPTVAAPFVYNNRELSGTPDFLHRVENILGYPMIVKEAYGSLGMQVYLINDREELSAIYSRLRHIPHLYQKYIAESRGLDIRVYVIGGKAAGACERRCGADFRSNIQFGGKMSVVTPDKEYIKIARKAAKLLNLDYCAVDFLQSNNGPLLCEVNSNAFFNTYVSLGGKDIALEYAKHISDGVG